MDSARGAIEPGLKILARYSQTGLGLSARPNGLKNPCNRYHFSARAEKGARACVSTVFLHLSKLAFCARAEIEHVIATIFQPGGRSEISARAEIHHVIRPKEDKINPTCLAMNNTPGYITKRRADLPS